MVFSGGSTLKDSDTRGRIVETAERFFRQYGYQKTTVADIAKALNMSPANVYRFFASKGEINEAVARLLTGKVEAAMLAIAAQPTPASQRVVGMLRTVQTLNSELYVSDRKMHEMVAVALAESWSVVRDHIFRMDAIMAQVIADGMAAGEFRQGDPATLARCVHCSVMRFCHPQLIVECADIPEPTLDKMIEFIMAGLGCQKPARYEWE